ncbi:MAG: hypothetical protein C0429_16610 [Sphingopyxis sp.]|nr:hypothetical protein [Sphingopyxis sp.]
MNALQTGSTFPRFHRQASPPEQLPASVVLSGSKSHAAFAASRGTSFVTKAELRTSPRKDRAPLNGRALAPAGGARGRALSWAAQRTWLALLAGRRLAHRPARTPPGCGLAKSAFVFARFARFFDALR